MVPTRTFGSAEGRSCFGEGRVGTSEVGMGLTCLRSSKPQSCPPSKRKRNQAVPRRRISQTPVLTTNKQLQPGALRLRVQDHEAPSNRDTNCLGAAAGPQLAQYAANVGLHSAQREVDFAADLPILLAIWHFLANSMIPRQMTKSHHSYILHDL